MSRVYADPLVIEWQSLGENEDGELAMFLSPEDIWKDEEPPVGHMQGNLMALRPYSISLGAPGPTGTAANPAGTNNMLDPLIHFDQEGFPGYPSEFEESAFVRGEDPMRPDIEDVVTRALLRETPDIDAAALRLKVAKYFLGKFFWLQNKPGPFDRGPLTLLQYLRVALHNGGFPQVSTGTQRSSRSAASSSRGSSLSKSMDPCLLVSLQDASWQRARQNTI